MPAYTNPGRIEFDSVITRNTEVANSSAWITFPFDVQKLYGVKGRVPVSVTFDGIPYRGSMVRMGGERHLLLILKDIYARLAKGPNDTVHVTVDLDEEERIITLPDDARAALEAHPAARAVWEKLSFSHQREYFLWIEEAKRPETRDRRIVTMCAKLVSDTPARS